MAVFAAAEPEADAGILGVNTLKLGYTNLGLSNIASPIGYGSIGLSAISRPIGYSNIGLSAISQPIASPIVSSIDAPAILSGSSLWKRDAEAEPEADAGLLGVNTLGLGYSNLGLSNIASPIGYSNIGLSTIAQPIATSPIVSSIAAPALATSYASPIVSNIAAPALAKSIASPIVSSIAAPAILSRSSLWKRDAEPEADPSFLGVNTLGYSNIGLSAIAQPIATSYASPIGISSISRPILTSNIGLSTLSTPIVSRIASPSIISRPLGLGRLGLW